MHPNRLGYPDKGEKPHQFDGPRNIARASCGTFPLSIFLQLGTNTATFGFEVASKFVRKRGDYFTVGWNMGDDIAKNSVHGVNYVGEFGQVG